jgi:pimeloyl-ACP methyl ester carboxylesterase
MPDSHTLKIAGRDVGYTDYGPRDGAPVLWCHGGPGSRLEPAAMAPSAADAGFRLIGIDRPGYGRSTPRPGRSIADWVADGLSVADALDVERFVAVGCSTGGAYSLALAAHARHTAAIVPGATLRIVPALGHMSIFGAVLPVLQSLKLKEKSQ